jgi:subtilisin family serine protease
VINISLGTYFGSHDGKDIQAQAIDNLISSAPGHIVVCSAGNAGTAPIHLGYDVSADTSFTWLQYSGNPIYIQGWCDSAAFASMHVGIGVDRTGNGYVPAGQLSFTTTGTVQNIISSDTIWHNGQRMAIVESLVQNWGDRYSYEYQIYPDSVMNVNGNDTTRYLYKMMATGSGRLDAWSFDMVFDNIPDTVTYPSARNYRKPDTEQTIVSSFTCSDKVITVGSYINRNRFTNVNYQTTEDLSLIPGNLSTFSSHGPTRDGRIKPDVTATGEWLLSCATQTELNIMAALEPAKVAAGKEHKRSSGTSMASPVVAGIAALYLQKNPTADWHEVKTAILSCADRDNATVFSLPDNNWGFGKVNGYNVVKGCNVGMDDLQFNYVFDVYPNPSHNNIVFDYDLSHINHHTASIVIKNILGETVHSISLADISNTTSYNNELQGGVYFASLMIDEKVKGTRKLIVF